MARHWAWTALLAMTAAGAWQWDLGGGTLTTDAQLRARLEARDSSDATATRDDNSTVLLTRTRLGLSYRPSASWLLRAQMQDSHTWEPSAPAAFEDGAELQEGFVRYQRGRWTGTLGRQPIKYADERLVGTFEWSNIARRFDAVKVDWKLNNGQVDVFLANLGDSPGTKGLDGQFAGAYASFPSLLGGKTDLFAFYNHHTQAVLNNIVTLGARHERQLGPVSVNALGAAQLGDMGAWAAVVEGVVPVGEWKLSALFAGASGDDTPGPAGGNNTFDNLFPTNHLHYGYLDLQGLRNLLNVQARATCDLGGGNSATIQYNSFWLQNDQDAWYGANGLPRRNGVAAFVDPTGGSGSHVGQELDLVLDLKLGASVKMQLLYGHLFPGGFVRARNLASGLGTHGADGLFWQVMADL